MDGHDWRTCFQRMNPRSYYCECDNYICLLLGKVYNGMCNNQSLCIRGPLLNVAQNKEPEPSLLGSGDIRIHERRPETELRKIGLWNRGGEWRSSSFALESITLF